MEYRTLGDTGIKISCISLGTNYNIGNYLTYQDSFLIVKKALELGINYIDTSEAFNFGECELCLGKILTELKLDRSNILVGTKLYYGSKNPLQVGLSRKHINDGLTNSLQRLNLSYVDFIIAHKPPDSNTSMLEVVRSFSIEINNKRALYWGTCDWPVNLITEAVQIAKEYNLIPPSFEQPQYNYLNRGKLELDIFDLNTVKHYNMGVISWGVLGSGILSGKYADFVDSNSSFSSNEKNYRLYRKDSISRAMLNWVKSDEGRFRLSVLREVEVIAKELNCTLAQLSIAWCLKQGNFLLNSVVIGVSSVDQLEENVKAIQIAALMDNIQYERINKILSNNKHLFTLQ